MSTALSSSSASVLEVTDTTPRTMLAAVYRGEGKVAVEEIEVPEIGPGELLIRVEACGICHTDLKKIEHDLLPPPRVYGHETAGVVAQVGEGVTKYQPGDRVIVFHHIPCNNCFYCSRKLYAQCAVYKKVGVTAGFAPAGGGFAQYVRVMDWIVERGIEKIPEGVSFDAASFVEPVNTCLKGIRQVNPQPGEVGAILGQGPIGLIFTMMAKALGKAGGQNGWTVVATDTMPVRRELAVRFGATAAVDPRGDELNQVLRAMTEDRGADWVIVAASASGIVEQAVKCSRPGARILLFAQTSHTERVEVSGADICAGERTLLGSYSSSVELQRESAELVFSGALPVGELVTHRYPLSRIHEGMERAMHPAGMPGEVSASHVPALHSNDVSLKIVVSPQHES